MKRSNVLEVVLVSLFALFTMASNQVSHASNIVDQTEIGSPPLANADLQALARPNQPAQPPQVLRLENDAPALSRGDFWETVKVGDLKRNFIVHVPAQIDRTKKIPVVLVFHGGSGSAKGMSRITKFNEIADAHNALVVYPDSMQKYWNDGRGIDDRAKFDDVSFVSSMINLLTRNYNADPKRLYVTGISNGGFFTQRLALEMPNKIAAIAVVDAGINPKMEQLAKVDIPVSALFILGTKDPLVPFDGGTIAPIFGGRGSVLSARQTIDFWIAHNHCSAAGQTRSWPLSDMRDPTRVTETTYLPVGQSGKTVVVDVVEGGGHTWPSGVQYLPKAIIGATSRQICNEDIWNFFQDKHLD